MKKLMTILLMRTIMKNTLITIFAIFLAIGFVSNIAKATETGTIATFEDPSGNSSFPLFRVDFATNLLTGEWFGDGLTLNIPYNGHTFYDVWFEMTDVEIYALGDIDEAGQINFYANNTSTNPLLTIDFESLSLSRFGFGADELIAASNVTISGSEITVPISQEEFSFSFANKKKLPNQTGFTATAAFTSSAVIPEPATICILSLGALSLLRRKK